MTSSELALLAAALVLLVLFLAAGQIGLRWFEPLPLVVLTYLGFGTLGAAFFLHFDAAVGSVSRTVFLNWEETTETLRLYFVVASVMLVSGIASHAVLSTFHYRPVAADTARAKSRAGIAPYVVPAAIALGLFSLIARVFGVGTSNLIRADEYLALDSAILFSMSALTTPIAGVLLGMAIPKAKESVGIRTWIFVLVVAYFIVLFSSATRSLALFFATVCAGFVVVKPPRLSILFIAIPIVGGLIIGLLCLPLFLRTLPQHGLVPYTEQLLALQSLALSDTFDTDSLVLLVLANVLYAFPLTAEIAAHGPAHGIEYLLTAVNPLPGFLTSWANIAEELRLDEFTPFNTLGEAHSYGLLATICYFSAVGITVGALNYRVRVLWNTGRALQAVAIAVLLLCFALISMQYNLRTSTRFLYLALLLCVLGVLPSTLPKVRQRTSVA